jgi:hypothetical protein
MYSGYNRAHDYISRLPGAKAKPEILHELQEKYQTDNPAATPEAHAH